MKLATAILVLHQANQDGTVWYEVWVTCNQHLKKNYQSIIVHTRNKRVVKREVENRLGIVIPLRKVFWCEKKGISYGRFASRPSSRELTGYNTSPVFSIFEA